MSEEYTTVDREFSWDDEISNEGSEFVLLPEGEYTFEVIKFERGRSKGSDKLPSCNMAILTFRVGDDSQSTTIIDQLVLHSKLEWKLCSFFRCIGQKKHDEPLRMNWSAVTGAKGRCRVIVEEWKKRDGTTGRSNRIDRYLDPEEDVAPAAGAAPHAPAGGFWG